MLHLMFVSRRFRDGVQDLIKRRIMNILLHFIGEYKQVETLIQDMRSCSAVIYGSMVRLVLRKSFTPRDNINFAVSKDQSRRFRGALSNILRSYPVKAPVQPERNTVIQRWILTSHQSNRLVTLDVGFQKSSLAVVLNAGTTAQMDFVTSDHLVSLYPTLIYQGRSLNVNGDQHSQDSQRELGLTSTPHNSWWSGPCGFNCPSMHRTIAGLQGIGTVNWGDTTTMTWEHDESAWYLGMRCSNGDCEQPRDEGYEASDGAPSSYIA
ncbi:hypothetical protein C8J56DRAFT_940599 [Mycena floridula]|nr:hypothetical protein C8J56DRAFT_940599 [Mycena floridula]